MEKTKIEDSFQPVYAYSLCIFWLFMADVSWLSWLPSLLTYAYILVISSVKLSKRTIPITLYEAISIGLLFFYFLLSAIVWEVSRSFGLLVNLAKFISLVSVVLLPVKEKLYLLKAIINCFVVILLISIPAWILYLLGVPLPHSGLIYHSDNFHEFYDYYFFRVAAKFSFFPRFGSIFLEPGQLATPCAFLWYLNGANFSRKNIVLLVAIILSFSLVGYGLVAFGFVARRIVDTSKYRILKVFLALSVVLGAFFYLSQNESSDDPVQELILSRLEYDDELGIVGNNRLSGQFRARYEVFIKSSDRYLGIHDKLVSGYDWTGNCAGIQKFIVHRGIIGFSVFMMFILTLFWYKRSLSSLLWLTILMMAFATRDMLQTPLWSGIAVIGFYLMNALRFRSI